MVTIYSGQTVVAVNDDWASADAARVNAATARVGAFRLPEDSRDSGLLVTHLPGLPSRYARQAEAFVLPGETATFTFRIAGTADLPQTIRLRPVVDGVRWLEDEGLYLVVDRG